MANILNKAIQSSIKGKTLSSVAISYLMAVDEKQRHAEKHVSLQYHNPTSRNWAPATVLQSRYFDYYNMA
jgi:hypothetical protein